jgi:hypothetical protein
MNDKDHLDQWLAVRRRLHQEERAVAKAEEARSRGEPVDVEELSIQRSEIRALRALSRALIRRSIQATPGGDRQGGGPSRERKG